MNDIFAFRKFPVQDVIFTECVKYLRAAECQIYISFTLR